MSDESQQIKNNLYNLGEKKGLSQEQVNNFIVECENDLSKAYLKVAYYESEQAKKDKKAQDNGDSEGPDIKEEKLAVIAVIPDKLFNAYAISKAKKKETDGKYYAVDDNGKLLVQEKNGKKSYVEVKEKRGKLLYCLNEKGKIKVIRSTGKLATAKIEENKWYDAKYIESEYNGFVTLYSFGFTECEEDSEFTPEDALILYSKYLKTSVTETKDNSLCITLLRFWENKENPFIHQMEGSFTEKDPVTGDNVYVNSNTEYYETEAVTGFFIGTIKCRVSKGKPIYKIVDPARVTSMITNYN